MDTSLSIDHYSHHSSRLNRRGSGAMDTPSKQRLFMTGATGYIGSVITEFAIARGYKVRGLSRNETGDAKLTALGAVPVRGDLGSFDVLTRECSDADVVMHLADTVLENLGMDYSVVLRIDAAAVDAMRKGLEGTNKRLIVTSGSLVSKANADGSETTEVSELWEDPPFQRHLSEQNALSLCQKGIKVNAIRLAPFVYGRGGSGIRMFMSMFFQMGKAAYIDDGSIQTSNVHVDDAARLYLLVMENAKAGEVFNATTSDYVSFRQLTEAMASVLGLPAVSQTYKEIEENSGKLLAKLFSMENRASSAKAVKELGWETKEIGILNDITSGSYVALAQEMKHTNTA